MRRVKYFCIAMLVSVSVILGMAGCAASNQGGQSADPDKTSVTVGQTHTDYEGVEIRIADVVRRETEIKLEVKWINNTEHDVIYGAAYAIEREEDGQWTDCAMADDLAFIEIAYELPANSEQTESYKITDNFRISGPGKYRLRTECYVYAGGEESSKCGLWAEFTVSDDGETGKEAAGAPVSLEYGVQYIRTNGYRDGARFPGVCIIRSREELNDYYKNNKDTFDLERKEQVYSDTTIGFLDACDRYDDSFFESKYLIFVLLEEGSGSVRHEVTQVQQTSDKQISVLIDTVTPEVGTCDMAEWHIILELSRSAEVAGEADVLLYLYNRQETENEEETSAAETNANAENHDANAEVNGEHTHRVAAQPQTVDDPISGYCGNMVTTLYIDGEAYTFMYDHSVALTDILVNLDYDEGKLCRCLPEYTADTEFGKGYGINLSQGYARCDRGQADLTVSQIKRIAAIVEWAMCQEPDM